MVDSEKPAILMNDRDVITLMKGLAIAFVFIHHWFGWLPSQSGTIFSLLTQSAVFAGTFVQIFFVASGYGLTKSAIQKPINDWRKWCKHRTVSLLIPYWGITTIMFLMAKESLCFFDKGGDSLPWSILLAHLFLLRNFFQSSWGFNDSLWFIPVIFGLYMIFPLLFRVLRKSQWAFIILSGVLGVGSLCLFSLGGFSTCHYAAFFTFHIPQFALGMLLAKKGILIFSFSRMRWLVAGVGGYLISFLLIKVHPALRDYNEIFNAIGAVIVSVFLCRILSYITFLRKITMFVGENSYALYLLHGVFILYLAKPLLQQIQYGTFEFLLFGGLLFGMLAALCPLVSAGISRCFDRFAGIIKQDGHCSPKQ
jgi:peptidoglycan/LPS O-acetylase OafA/YrhL